MKNTKTAVQKKLEKKVENKRDRILEPQYCPVCGGKLEIPADQSRTHIFNFHCDICKARFTLWITP